MFVSDGSPNNGSRDDASPAPRPPAERRRREARLRAAIAEANAATARVVELVAAMDKDESWGDHVGCLSPTHLLSWQCGVGKRDATRWVAAARKLRELPATRAAFAEGRLSLTQVESIASVASAATDASYVEWAAKMTAAQLCHLTRSAQRARRLQEDRAEESHRNRFYYSYFTDDGDYRLSGRLTGEAGTILEKALDVAHRELDRDAAAEPEQPEQWGARRADALVQVAEASLASSATRSGGDATQVVVHVTPEALAAGADDGLSPEPSRCEIEGVGLTPEAARRLTCDAAMVTLVEDAEGNPLNIGRKTRRISPALRRALRARDPHCRFPGCNNARFLDAHHVTHWIADGKTAPENLSNLCRRHHRMVHEGLFSMERRGDDFVFYDRWGHEIRAAGDVVAATGPPLGMRLAAEGIAIDDTTCEPRWEGDRLTPYGIDVILEHHQGLDAIPADRDSPAAPGP